MSLQARASLGRQLQRYSSCQRISTYLQLIRFVELEKPEIYLNFYREIADRQASHKKNRSRRTASSKSSYRPVAIFVFIAISFFLGTLATRIWYSRAVFWFSTFGIPSRDFEFAGSKLFTAVKGLPSELPDDYYRVYEMDGQAEIWPIWLIFAKVAEPRENQNAWWLRGSRTRATRLGYRD